jgi:hypothetical protein
MGIDGIKCLVRQKEKIPVKSLGYIGRIPHHLTIIGWQGELVFFT